MFYAKFVELCAQKGTTRTKACVDCGISRTAWHKWEKGGVPNGTTLNKIAAYFGVTASDLLGEGTKKDPETLTGIEAKLVDLLTQLNPSEEEKVVAYIEGLLANRTI